MKRDEEKTEEAGEEHGVVIGEETDQPAVGGRGVWGRGGGGIGGAVHPVDDRLNLTGQSALG